jgi:uncharacterized protein YkwD
MTRLLAFCLLVLSCQTAQAQCPAPAAYGPRHVLATPQAPIAAAAPAVAVADTTGATFTVWLNATRAAYGVAAVAYDPDLEAWGQRNNAQQAARGLGHYVQGPARRQNSAWGSYAQIGAMWLGSSAHRSALLDPSIRFVGLAGWAGYWTFNGR